MKRLAMPLEETCCEHSGVGRWVCHCAALWGRGLWEVRTDLPANRTARVLICLYQDHLVALHGFIKKTRATPVEDMALARKRQREIES